MPGRARSAVASSPTIVLLRAVNVGGHATVRPKDLAKRLSEFDVTSVGAAGSFVARRAPEPQRLSTAFLDALGFDTEVIHLTLPELTDLLDEGRPEWRSPPDGTRRFLTFLASDPTKDPKLPIQAPTGAGWHLRVIERRGRAVLTIRRVPASVPWTYPNPVVEKAFGAPATTRGWETLDELRVRAT